MFPQSSVAVQVLVTLYSPAQSPGVVTSLDVKVKLPQSAAVATAKTGVAGQSIVVGSGRTAITGASSSVIITFCSQEATGDPPSRINQVIVVVPIG